MSVGKLEVGWVIGRHCCPIAAYLTSQSATVVSSLQVANVLQSKNLSEIVTTAPAFFV